MSQGCDDCLVFLAPAIAIACLIDTADYSAVADWPLRYVGRHKSEINQIISIIEYCFCSGEAFSGCNTLR